MYLKKIGDDMKSTSIHDKDITVWFSCGAASAVAAKKTLELYGSNNRVRVVNNPIKEEHQDNQRFLKDVEKWLKMSKQSCFVMFSLIKTGSKFCF